MIRLTLLTLFITYFSVTAFKDWYRSLCVLVVLTGIVQHPDMPSSMLGIQGLNPWNILMLFVLAGWMLNKNTEGSNVALPGGIKVLLVAYIFVMLISTIRLLGDYDQYVIQQSLIATDIPSKGSIISEHIINAMKWFVPGYLMYKGCNSRKRLYWGVGALCLVYVILAVQVIRWMPLSALGSGDGLSERSLKILSNEVGFHRVNLAMLLAGGSWAIFCARLWCDKKLHFFFIVLTSLMLLFAVALTGGRTGYVTWAFVGMILAFIKWKRYIILAPIPVLILYLLVPAAFDRLSQGLDDDQPMEKVSSRLEDELIHTPTDQVLYEVTSGRNVAWPFVLEKIAERPWVGHGRLAMVKTGIAAHLWTNYSESFPHPHNLYLEFIFENGILGFFPVILFFLIMLKRSLTLLKDRFDPDYQVVGGVCLSLLLALLFAGIGSQTFYPREGAVAMWCAIGLMLRVWSERKTLLDAGDNPETASPSRRLLWSTG